MATAGIFFAAIFAGSLATAAPEFQDAEPQVSHRSTVAHYNIEPGDGGAARSDSDERSTTESGLYQETSQVSDSFQGLVANASATMNTTLSDWDGQALSGGGDGSVTISGSADAAGVQGAEAACNASSTVEFAFSVSAPVTFEFDATIEAAVGEDTGAEVVTSLSIARLCQEGGGCSFFNVLGPSLEPLEISESGELSEGDYLLIVESSAALTVARVGSAASSSGYDFNFLVVPEPGMLDLQLAALASLVATASHRRRALLARSARARIRIYGARGSAAQAPSVTRARRARPAKVGPASSATA